MGSISMIARRLPDGRVQYGRCGNNSCPLLNGVMLLKWYDTPEMVEYLFGLGQLVSLWKPYNEGRETDDIWETVQMGEPHWVGQSECEIFNGKHDIEEAYFYDQDCTWYYIYRGLFEETFYIKLPLAWVARNCNERLGKFAGSKLKRNVGKRVMDEIWDERYADGLKQRGFDRDEFVQDGKVSFSCIYQWYSLLCSCFDDWAVVKPDESGENIGEIIVRLKEEKHTETIFW